MVRFMVRVRARHMGRDVDRVANVDARLTSWVWPQLEPPIRLYRELALTEGPDPNPGHIRTPNPIANRRLWLEIEPANA